MTSLKELMDLHGRVAVVTGGAGRLGVPMCEALAELGANVAVVDKSAEPCRQAAAQLQQTFGVDAESLVVDLANESDTKSVCTRVLDRFGRLDILVNSAAFTGSSGLEGWVTGFDKQTAETWRKVVEVNLIAPFVLAQSCASALAKSGKGSVINIGSTYGVVGPDMRIYAGTEMGNPAAYAGTKGGILQLTRWLATVMAPSVRVNSITPGGVWAGQPEPFHKAYVHRTPLGRMGKESDFKGAVAYLASDLSAYVTGHNLVVDGGWTAW